MPEPEDISQTNLSQYQMSHIVTLVALVGLFGSPQQTTAADAIGLTRNSDRVYETFLNVAVNSPAVDARKL